MAHVRESTVLQGLCHDRYVGLMLRMSMLAALAGTRNRIHFRTRHERQTEASADSSNLLGNRLSVQTVIC